MNEIIATSTDGQYRVVASTEHEAESPRWGAEFGVMYAAHSRYTLGDQHVGVLSDLDTILQEHGTTVAIQWLVAEHGTTVILPLYLYDHGGLSIRAGSNLLGDGPHEHRHSGDWDTSMVGAIFDTAANRLDWVGDSEAVLRAEVEEYDMYLQGRVYTLVVERQAIEVTRRTRTYADGASAESVSTQVVWVQVDDSGYVSTYGEKDHPTIAANLLHQFEAPVSNS